MNRKLYALIVFFSLIFVFAACGDDEENTDLIVWKSHQDKIFRDSVNSGHFSELQSGTRNGSVYYRKSNEIGTKSIIEITDTPPLFTDSVVCRFTGWYYNSNNQKIIFDGTEDGFNLQGGIGFPLNGNGGMDSSIGVKHIVIGGWADILQIMKVNDEYEICVPQQLAYGYNGWYYNSSNSQRVYVVPQYTTVFYNIKLLKIIRKTSTDD